MSSRPARVPRRRSPYHEIGGDLGQQGGEVVHLLLAGGGGAAPVPQRAGIGEQVPEPGARSLGGRTPITSRSTATAIGRRAWRLSNAPDSSRITLTGEAIPSAVS